MRLRGVIRKMPPNIEASVVPIWVIAPSRPRLPPLAREPAEEMTWARDRRGWMKLLR